MAAFGIKAIQPQDNEHIFGFATARGTADDSLLEVWNGPTQSDLRFTIDKEGQLQTRDGTLARPTYSFESDKDSGRYLSGAASMVDVISGAAVGTWTAGKLALAGDLEVGDDVTLKSDAAVLNFGADSDVSLTHVHNTGLLLNSTMAIQFNDASQYINAPSATVLDINATDEIELNATAVDLNGTLDVSGAATLATSLNIASDGATVTGIKDEDDMASNSAVKLATQQSIKAYVDAQVTGADLDFAGDSGTGAVDLDSQTFTIAGTSNEIVTVAGSQTITIGLPDDVTIGDDLTLGSDAAVLNFGAGSDVSLTHVHDTGLLLNSSRQLQFGDSASYIAQSSDGVLRIDGEATIDLNASTAVTVSNDLKLDSDAAVLGFGVNNDVTLTHVHDTGLLLNGTMQLQFNDASQNITAPSATVLDINATDEIELNATAVDLNGTLDVSGAATLATSLNIASDGATVTGIKDEDDMSSNSATKLATQQSIKAYVDAQITAEDLDFAGDSGTGAVDLDGQTFTIAGTANEIVTSASGQTITIALPDDVTIGDDLTIADNLTFSSDSAVVTFGVHGDTTLTHTDGVGLTLNGTNKLTFGDAASFVQQSGDGVLRIDGEATIDLNASTKVDVSAALDVGTDLTVGDDIYLDSDAAVMHFGDDGEVTLTHVHGTGLLLNSTMALQFNDASQYINAPSATVLDINATDEIELNATLVDVNANLDVSGTTTIDGDVTVDTDTLFVDVSSDRVGLGTTSPDTMLELKESSTAAADAVIRLRGHGNDSDNTVLGALEWYNADSSGDQPGVVCRIEGVSGNSNGHMGEILFKTHDGSESGGEGSNPVERMRIDNSGNVGIGTASPADIIDFQKNQNATTNFYLRNTDTTDTSSRAYLNIISGNRTLQLGAINADHSYINAPSGADLYFQDGGTNNMVITGGGRVGIGTTAPGDYYSGSNKFVVANTGGSTGMTFATSNTGQARIDFAEGTSGGEQYRATIMYQHAATEAEGYLRFVSAENEIFRMEQTIVTCGRLSSQASTVDGHQWFASGGYYNYHAAGEVVRWYNSDNGNDVGSIDTSTSSTAYNTSSDRRLKENIEASDPSGSLIDSIEIVKHDWISSDDHVRYGVVAQDLFEVLPEAVSQGTDGDFVDEDLSKKEQPIKQVWGVDYSKLVPLLVKEVQDLRARIAQLEA